MSMSDPLGDMLTRIRNGQQAHKATITAPASRFRAEVLDVLREEGYIRGYSQAEISNGINEMTIELKYHDGHPVIKEIRRVSTLWRSRDRNIVDAKGRVVGCRRSR
jgi:small subunit ribosomal protein S8